MSSSQYVQLLGLGLSLVQFLGGMSYPSDRLDVSVHYYYYYYYFFPRSEECIILWLWEVGMTRK